MRPIQLLHILEDICPFCEKKLKEDKFIRSRPFCCSKCRLLYNAEITNDINERRKILKGVQTGIQFKKYMNAVFPLKVSTQELKTLPREIKEKVCKYCRTQELCKYPCVDDDKPPLFTKRMMCSTWWKLLPDEYEFFKGEINNGMPN